MDTEKIILVDKKDREIGTEEKIKAHKEGKLHRAFSIFIFNSEGELLIQKRAKSKYHSPNLWSNTCCSHPKPKEHTENAARRRLKEEMGFDCELKEIFSFIYKDKVKSDSNFFEYEFDHVFTGKFDGKPLLNPREVSDYKWISGNKLNYDISKNPEKYTSWFKKAFSYLNK